MHVAILLDPLDERAHDTGCVVGLLHVVALGVAKHVHVPFRRALPVRFPPQEEILAPYPRSRMRGTSKFGIACFMPPMTHAQEPPRRALWCPQHCARLLHASQ
eukprot:9231922-Pyramimonas_sp.AAC.1